MRRLLGWMSSFQVAMCKVLEDKGLLTDYEVGQEMRGSLEENVLRVETMVKQMAGGSEA